MFKRLIEKKLGGYCQQLNNINTSQVPNLQKPKSVAVIGGGLAGMSAAAYLAPRGFKVDIFEKDTFIGGKIGSWPVSFEDGYQTNVEHGFHGFFRQYYNLRALMKTIGASKYFIPLSDYLIKTLDQGEFSFKHIDTTPIINLLSMARNGIYKLSDMMSWNRASNMLPFLRYNRDKTFRKYDKISFQEFIEEVNLPKELKLIFITFSRAFFAEPKYMSMAELIKSFHYYFLSNDLGIIYDVLDDDFEKTLWTPFRNYLRKYDYSINTGIEVDGIGFQGEKFSVSGKIYDYLIIASDVKNTPKIIKNSEDLKKANPEFARQLETIKTSQRYAVLRIWIDKNVKGDLPFFIFTDAVKILDSVTIYHQMEKTSADWVKKNGGGIFELHSYAVPDDMADGEEVRKQLLDEFEKYFPEIRDYKIRYEYFQFRNDFTAFHTNLYNSRPEYKTPVPNLYLAGDWVKLPCPAMLMEAATTSALYAANDIFQREGLREEPIFSVPLKGIFA
ncbi:MAG: FAD-dependent oxidoreductase [Calditrichia bacterium]